MKLSEWPGFRVLLFLVFWVVIVFVVAAWRTYWAVAATMSEDGAVMAAMDWKWPIVVAVGPPILLCLAWAIVRLRARRARS